MVNTIGCYCKFQPTNLVEKVRLSKPVRLTYKAVWVELVKLFFMELKQWCFCSKVVPLFTSSSKWKEANILTRTSFSSIQTLFKSSNILGDVTSPLKNIFFKARRALCRILRFSCWIKLIWKQCKHLFLRHAVQERQWTVRIKTPCSLLDIHSK